MPSNTNLGNGPVGEESVPDVSSNPSKRPREESRPGQQDDSGKLPKRRGRRRGALACEECRSRKRRCDGNLPACGECTQRRRNCDYPENNIFKVWRESFVRQSPSIRKEGDQEKVSNNVAIHDSDADKHATNSIPTPPSASFMEKQIHPTSGEDRFPSKNTTEDARFRARIDSSNTHAAGQIFAAHLPASFNEPRAAEHLMGPIQQAISSAGSDMSPASLPPAKSPQAIKSAGKTASRCACDDALRAMDWNLPMRKQADELVEIYFARFQLMFPFLHEPTFKRQYDQIWASTSSSDLTATATKCSGLCQQRSLGKVFPATLNVIFALGSLFLPIAPSKIMVQASTFFTRSQSLDFFDIIDSAIGLELVQLMLLMGFYLQSTEKFSKCWNISGFAIRAAQDMGLHLRREEALRRGFIGEDTSQLDLEMRSRVWYGCVLLDREIALSFGQARLLPTSCGHPPLPEAIDDQYISTETSSCSKQPEGSTSLREAYLQYIKLYEILGSIMDRNEQLSLAPAEIKTPIQGFLELETALNDWIENLPPKLQYSHDVHLRGSNASVHQSQGSDMKLAHQASRLHARYLHVRLLLLRPALVWIFQRQEVNGLTPTKSSMQSRIQDHAIDILAVECTKSAQELVGWVVRSESFSEIPAWWYTVGHLYSSGSVILMAQKCHMNDPSSELGSLSQSWEACLDCLRHYHELSSVARKSSQLLSIGSERLVAPQGAVQVVQESTVNANHTPGTATYQQVVVPHASAAQVTDSNSDNTNANEFTGDAQNTGGEANFDMADLVPMQCHNFVQVSPLAIPSFDDNLLQQEILSTGWARMEDMWNEDLSTGSRLPYMSISADLDPWIFNDQPLKF